MIKYHLISGQNKSEKKRQPNDFFFFFLNVIFQNEIFEDLILNEDEVIVKECLIFSLNFIIHFRVT